MGDKQLKTNQVPISKKRGACRIEIVQLGTYKI